VYESEFGVFRVSWYTAGTRNRGTTGEVQEIKFSWTDGDQSDVTGAQFWFYVQARGYPGNRIVYFTDGNVTTIVIYERMSVVWCAICILLGLFLFSFRISGF